jgi:hypothetical protein
MIIAIASKRQYEASLIVHIWALTQEARRNITRAALMRIGQQLAVGPGRVS